MNANPAAGPGKIGVALSSQNLTVTPGSSVSLEVRVRNRGQQEDTFQLTLKGVPQVWLRSTSSTVSLAAGEEKSLALSIHPPRSPKSEAGRYPLTVRVASRGEPAQAEEIEATLTVTAFSEFEVELQPTPLYDRQTGVVTIENLGNYPELFTLSWRSPADELAFNPVQTQRVKVDPGRASSVEFSARPHFRAWFASQTEYALAVEVRSSRDEVKVASGTLMSRGLFPSWIIPAALALAAGLVCVLVIWIGGQSGRAGRATQTAVAAQTALALDSLNADLDGDGLTAAQEVEAGTDPNNPDSDGDGVFDKAELDLGLQPQDPDTDRDGLNDGEELRRGSDPLNPDTDGDALTDGQEVNQFGTSPIDPDTDGDGLIDSADPDPLSLGTQTPVPTETAAPTAIPPTEVPTEVPTQAPTATATEPALTQTPIPELGVIAFASDRDGNVEIYLLEINEQSLVRMTNNAAEDTQPAWSPNGNRLAFVSDRDGNQEVYLMNADGTGQVNLTDHPAADAEPAWSPDGQWIAFSSDRDGNPEIYLQSAAGGEPLRLTEHAAVDRHPTWLSDDWLVFNTDRDGNWEIYLLNVDDGDPFNISLHPANDLDPVAAPALERITFSSDRGGDLNIYRMNGDGSGQIQVNSNPGEDRSPTWPANGFWIAFVTTRDGNEEIYVISTDGAEQVNLTNAPSADRHPSWYIP